MSKKPILVLVCGCSGSGKSTFAEKISRMYGYKHLDVDEFYKIPGTSQRRDKFCAWMDFFTAIHSAEVSGIDCVADTAALTSSSREEFLNWFPGFEHHMVFIEAEHMLRFENNDGRERRVPIDVMLRQDIIVERPVWRTMDKAWISYTLIENRYNHYNVKQSEGKTFYESSEEISG